ncbi:MAG: sulfurtransferase [Rhodocyclaceae bacterium]|nr:sulfurtransferase [Rhodocyclaceae bacterium]
MIRLIICCIALLLPLSGIAQKPGLPGAIVDAQWLARNLDAPNLVVLDTRKTEEYQAGHVKGAVSIPAYQKLFAAGYLIPGIKEIREIVAAAGIGNASRVVIYDNGEFIWAARAYWLLETFGVANVALLDVGYGDWPQGLLPESTAAPQIKRSNFVPRFDKRRLETKLSTRLAMTNPGRVIIDGRSAAEYRGEKSKAKRFGYIPDAMNLPWSDNLARTEDSDRLRPLGELKSIYARLPRDKDYLLYCNGGAQAALNYVVMQALGYKVSVYDGSWFEWGSDPELPITGPSAP